MIVSFISNVISTSSKMVRFTFAAGLAFAVLTTIVAEELYSDKYDDVNVKEILENERLRSQYYNCFIGTAPCATADAKFFKGNLPEVIVTKCRKCTEKQKEMFETLVSWYTENRPAEWEAAITKFIEDAKKRNVSA